MEDYFQGGMSESLWSSSKCDNYDPMTIWGGTSNGLGTLDWTACEIEPGKSRSSDGPTSSPSGSTITSQDIHNPHILDHFAGGSFGESALAAPLYALSPSSVEWNQTLFNSGRDRDETSFHAMHQEDLSSKPMFLQDLLMDNMNQSLQDQRRMSYDGPSSGCGSNNFQLTPTSYGYIPVSLPGLFETETELQASNNDNGPVNHRALMIAHCGITSKEVPQFFKGLPATEQYTKQWHHSNNLPSWINASAAPASEVKSLHQSSKPTQFATQRLEQKFNCSNPTMKSNTKSVQDSSSPSMKKANSSEPSPKKPRIDMPSSLPSFKVRKEKLGDRITALQQLVSPFGKTDTASVLHETVEYIKFLHDQVSGLSTTYLKTGYPMQQQQNPDKPKDSDDAKQDLRSRGLCLVPIASTYSVATESSADIWASAFGAIYSNRRAESSLLATRQEDPSTRRLQLQVSSNNSIQVQAVAKHFAGEPFL